jgi:hypothetical protein
MEDPHDRRAAATAARFSASSDAVGASRSKIGER